MGYAFICEDAPNSLALRTANRSDHLARLQQLQTAGKLLVAGPFPAIDNEDPGKAGFTGSLIIAGFDSLAQAQQWAGLEPFLKCGVYQNIVVKPYKKVLP